MQTNWGGGLGLCKCSIVMWFVRKPETPMFYWINIVVKSYAVLILNEHYKENSHLLQGCLNCDLFSSYKTVIATKTCFQLYKVYRQNVMSECKVRHWCRLYGVICKWTSMMRNQWRWHLVRECCWRPLNVFSYIMLCGFLITYRICS